MDEDTDTMTVRILGWSVRLAAVACLLAIVIGMPGQLALPSGPLVAAGPLSQDEAPAPQERHAASAEDSDQSVNSLPIIREPGVDSRRPSVTREPSGPADRETAPAALVRPVLVSASVSYAGQNAPLVFAEESLPWRFHVERHLGDRLGLQAVVDAVAQWDGIPGSRWATAFSGVTEERVNQATADGRSVIFSQAQCPPGVGGYAYWQTATATPDNRYGVAVVYITEVDIGICPAVTTVGMLGAVIAHEVGHALGLEHLYDPGQPGWKAAMGQGPHECRVMYASPSSCRKRIGEVEQTGAIHQYPTLRRLSGPSRLETAARASYAGYGTRSADTVVIARADGSAHGPLAAAALSGAVSGPLLLGRPGASECLTGTTAEELARVAADPGTVILVGDWPSACEADLAAWNLSVERVGGALDPVGLGVAVAQRMASSGHMGDAVFVVSDRADASGHVPDGVAAGAAAGAVGAPVLYTAPDGLAPAVGTWLRGHSRVRRAYVMGGVAALSERVTADLRDLGIEVVRVGGSTRVGTSIALASRAELFDGSGPIVLATAGSWADAVTGSSTGARLGAPVIVTPPSGESQVERWIAARSPRGGYVVGGSAAIPYELQWRYSRHTR